MQGVNEACIKQRDQTYSISASHDAQLRRRQILCYAWRVSCQLQIAALIIEKRSRSMALKRVYIPWSLIRVYTHFVLVAVVGRPTHSFLISGQTDHTSCECLPPLPLPFSARRATSVANHPCGLFANRPSIGCAQSICICFPFRSRSFAHYRDAYCSMLLTCSMCRLTLPDNASTVSTGQRACSKPGMCTNISDALR